MRLVRWPRNRSWGRCRPTSWPVAPGTNPRQALEPDEGRLPGPARDAEQLVAQLQSDLVADRPWYQPAPGDLARPGRLVRADDVLSDHRVDAVGADQQVATGRASVGESDPDLRGVLRHRDAARAE